MPRTSASRTIRSSASIRSTTMAAVTRRRLAAFSLVTLLVFGGPGFAVLAQGLAAPAGDDISLLGAKADPRLREIYRQAVVERDRIVAQPGAGRRPAMRINSETGSLERVAGLEQTSSGDLSVSVTVRLSSASADELKAAGFAIGSRIGDVATVYTDPARLPELAALASVRNIHSETYRRPLNDRARQAVGIDNASGQRVVPQTGRGVVVGIIDTGIDFRHGDFIKPGTQQTRIKALWDISDKRDDYTVPGSTTKRGHMYTESDINAALQQPKPSSPTSDIVRERDINGHGTHVAGTAAGNGYGGTATPGTYAGMAPEADLVIVKADRNDDGGFSSTDEINGLNFISQQAVALGEPFVINMSLGGQLGPHDGSGADEIAIDNLVNGAAGRAVCIAAGNEGSDSIHADGTVPAGGSLTLGLNLVKDSSATQAIDLYHGRTDRYRVTVTPPSGTTVKPVTLNFDSSDTSQSLLNVYYSNDPQNNQPDLYIEFEQGAPSGNWTITLQDADSNPNAAFDAWMDTGQTSQFTSNVDNNTHLVGSPGTSRGAITVGAWVTRSASQTVGDYAYFTSPGPTADGRQKPEIAAPGYYLYSSRSSDVSSSGVSYTYGSGTNGVAGSDTVHYGGLAGTSMATPVTTGSVALLLQGNRNLTNAQIKSYIENSAGHDQYAPAGWSSHWGFGKLNVAGAIAAAGVSTYTISGHVADAKGNVINHVVVTLSGGQSSSVETDANGNFSFANLAGGATYTVTPSKPDYNFGATSQSFSALAANQSVTFTATPTNPIWDSRFFVAQQYTDFLNRAPEAQGFSDWMGYVDTCDNDAQCLINHRVETSADFFRSNEFFDTGFFVWRMYRATLVPSRRPTYVEFTRDAPQVHYGVGGDQTAPSQLAFAQNWLQRSDIQATYGSDATTGAFIDHVAQAAGVTLSSTERNQLLAQSRAAILVAIANHQEVSTREFNAAFVAMQYFGYLRRDPEDAGYNAWLGYLNANPTDYSTMVHGFVYSLEYQSRFGPAQYR